MWGLFAVDVRRSRCAGRRRIVAVHTRIETLRPLLTRLGVVVPPPPTRRGRPAGT